MEFVIANAGKIKRETYNGRSYIVAPVTMIVPGVLNGSQGALYYPPDEVTKDVGIWNAVPLTIGHPFDKNGQNVSARSPETLDRFQIGYVFNDRVDNGNRLADGYFDVEWTKVKAPEVYKAINSGSPMELSTGLYTNNVPVDNGRSPKGDAYQFVARDYRPDHLAILPNQRGACSIKDGCGLNVNAESDVNKKCGGDESGCVEIDAKATTGEAERMGSMPLNAFCPTGEGGGLDNSCGKEGGSGDSAIAKKESSVDKSPQPTQGTAKNVGQMIAQKVGGTHVSTKVLKTAISTTIIHRIKGDGSNKTVQKINQAFDKTKFPVRGIKPTRTGWKFTAEDKDGAYHHFYVTDNAASNQPKSLNTGKYKKNGAGTGKGAPHQSAQDGYHGGPKPCECGTCEQCLAKTTLNKFKGVVMNRDDNIKWLTTNCECHKNKSAVLANEENYSDAEIDALVKNEQGSQAAKLVVNGLAKVLPEIGAMAINEIPAFVEGKMKKDDDEEEAPVEEEETEEEVVENKKQVANQLTPQQFLDLAPPEIRELVSNALQQKSDLVKKLVANTKNAATKEKLTKKYMEFSVNELKEMIADMPKPTTKQRPIVNEAPKPLYLGSFTPTVNEAQDEGDLLVPPTINWAESAKRK